MLQEIEDGTVDTGLVFRGYPVLLGRRSRDSMMADGITLTFLDRFLKKHLPPSLIDDYPIRYDRYMVKGAKPCFKK
jgi:hypothetical protein